MELGSLEIIIIILAITVGAVVHGTLGIGFPLVATPIIALVTDVRIAIIILLIPTMAVNIASILSGGRFVDVIKRFWFVLIFVGIGSYAGTSLLVLVDPNPFRLLLALVILFYLFTSAGDSRRIAPHERRVAGLHPPHAPPTAPVR